MMEVHMARWARLILPLIFPVLTSGALAGQSPDIAGTWIGDAVMPGSSTPARITLVLGKTGDSYSGKFSASRGLADEAPLEDVTFTDRNFRGKVSIKSNGEDLKLTIGLNLFSDRLMGERLLGGWGIGRETFEKWLGRRDMDLYGVLDLSRKK
jgi:hypothetical protein